MTCKDTTLPQKLDHLKHHHKHLCPHCATLMTLEDGSLPFDESLMTTWNCPRCQSTDITILQKDGTLLHVASKN